MKAILALEDGTIFEGESLGASGETFGEVVFNTGMTGYQEILTDPSYAGQIVCLTYPMIGNYGVNADDFESRRVQVEGFIVREAESEPSNWRSGQTLNAFLKERKIVGIRGIDTRALTRALRVRGVMMGAISTEESAAALLSRIRSSPSYSGIDFVRKVTTEEPYEWSFEGEPEFHVALLDCGVKFNIMRSLAKVGCKTTVYPCTTPAEAILERNPDGIMLSPGPGDPALLGYVVETVKKLAAKKPIMGVCLGNQLLGYAFGSRTFKLKFGHRGSNHPVKDLTTGRVYITSQNHGFAVDPNELKDGMEVAHINLNDGTVEGLRHRELPIFSIQYHPEASPGPTDSAYFFRQFVEMLRKQRGDRDVSGESAS
jgi:carbamoyl-phosphate synthase small subunit